MQPLRRPARRGAAGAALLLLAFCSVAPAAALYEPGDGVTLLESLDDYKQAVMTSPGPALVSGRRRAADLRRENFCIHACPMRAHAAPCGPMQAHADP